MAKENGMEPRMDSVIKSERGVVLVVVLVLSAVALALITTLLYIVMSGTQTSGLQKRYRTALEAGLAGKDVMGDIISQGGSTTSVSSLGLATQTSNTCTGTTLSGTPYTGFMAKIMTSSTTWSAGCNSSLNIDPANPATYDITFTVGTNPQYNVYGKIVATVQGNSGFTGSGVSTNLWTQGVVSSGGGEIAIPSLPYLYTIELDAERAGSSSERAKLSVLYQY